MIASPTQVHITLSPFRATGPFLGRLAIVCGSQIGVIGVGTVAGSAAMQWCGFALLAFALVSPARRTPTYTPQQAAEKLLAEYGVRARG